MHMCIGMLQLALRHTLTYTAPQPVLKTISQWDLSAHTSIALPVLSCLQWHCHKNSYFPIILCHQGDMHALLQPTHATAKARGVTRGSRGIGRLGNHRYMWLQYFFTSTGHSPAQAPPTEHCTETHQNDTPCRSATLYYLIQPYRPPASTQIQLQPPWYSTANMPSEGKFSIRERHANATQSVAAPVGRGSGGPARKPPSPCHATQPFTPPGQRLSARLTLISPERRSHQPYTASSRAPPSRPIPPQILAFLTLLVPQLNSPKRPCYDDVHLATPAIEAPTVTAPMRCRQGEDAEAPGAHLALQQSRGDTTRCRHVARPLSTS